MNPMTYAPDVKWRYHSLKLENEFVRGLALSWEVNGDPISDDYTSSDADAYELWRTWVRWLTAGAGHFDQTLGSPHVAIHWTVFSDPEPGHFESAPHQHDGLNPDDFLSFYAPPVDVETGEPINWLRLPVRDKLWNADEGDKGGFIQEASGWKPSPLQPTVDLRVFEAAGLPIS